MFYISTCLFNIMKNKSVARTSMTGPIQPSKESVPMDQVKAVSGHFRHLSEPSTELYWCLGHRVQDAAFTSVLKVPEGWG